MVRILQLLTICSRTWKSSGSIDEVLLLSRVITVHSSLSPFQNSPIFKTDPRRLSSQPFNGPIPPSNLLDKIARGVGQAKGPIPFHSKHSLQAFGARSRESERRKEKTTSLTTTTTAPGSPKAGKTTTTGTKMKEKKTKTTKPFLPMNLERNPSTFGEASPPLVCYSSVLPSLNSGGGGGGWSLLAMPLVVVVLLSLLKMLLLLGI